MTADHHVTPGGQTANSARVSQHVYYECVCGCVSMCVFIMAVFQTEHVSKGILILRNEA